VGRRIQGAQGLAKVRGARRQATDRGEALERRPQRGRGVGYTVLLGQMRKRGKIVVVSSAAVCAVEAAAWPSAVAHARPNSAT
jgi:hypothetical protein